MNKKVIKLPSFYYFMVILLTVMIGSPIQWIANAGIDQITPPSQDTWISDASYYVAPTKGTGTKADPVQIESAANLAYLAKNLSLYGAGKFLLQTNDIDLSGHLWIPIGSADASADFNFDGGNHIITNVKVNMPEKVFVGLFGDTTGVLSNIRLTNMDITGLRSGGGLCGLSEGYISDCSVSSSNITVLGNNVGGIAGNGDSGIKNCTVSNVKVKAYGSYAGGIRGYDSSGGGSVIENCYFTGKVEAKTYAAGICGYYGATLTNCYAEGDIVAEQYAAGLACKLFLNMTDCGFKGSISLTGTTNECASMVYDQAAPASIKDCYGIADIYLNTTDTEIYSIYGATPSYIQKSCFSYSNLHSASGAKEYRKYRLGSSETAAEAFSNWTYNAYINGGYPFPKGAFAIGGFEDHTDVISYMESYGFDKYLLEIKYMSSSTYGTDYYVELGQYPQTYVGSAMNTTLENWFSTSSPSIVDFYWVDQGTMTTQMNYASYRYTDGSTYVRIATPILYATDYTYEDGTNATTSVTWFKVEPIHWLILNYTDFEKGADPIVIAEKALTANVTWNKDPANGNLWSVKSNVRTWLNDRFYDDAFSSGDKGNIVYTTINNCSQSSEADGTGDDTSNYVWLLSTNESFGKCFTTDAQRRCSPTDFAIANYCYLNRNSNLSTAARPSGGTTIYWLRTAEPNTTSGARVLDHEGTLGNNGLDTKHYSVRPVLKLKLI